ILRGCGVVIDAICLLDSRALLDYAKAPTSWLLTRTRRDESDQTMNTNTIESKPRTTARKIAYAIIGLFFALIVCPLFVIGAYTILTSLMSL
ncbi:MAG: hypothetical protein JSW48_02855, partial [Betaproteobacteria bacterium]